MRKFLYTIVIVLLIVLAVLFALRLYGEDLTRMALVPTVDFAEQDALADNAYADPAMWFSRPGMGAPTDPARWQPAYREGMNAPATPAASASAAPLATSPANPNPAPSASPTLAAKPPFAVFFVHPTSYYESARWNAPLDDAQSQQFARIFVRGLGSAFNQASEIWAPRYRQATFGAFLADSPSSQKAIDAAYRDVSQAFDLFLASVDPQTPIVLAGHSQGALHVLRLLREKVAGTPLQARIAAVYPVGWPISVQHDLPSLPFPACAAPGQAACISSWVSFANDPDPAMMLGLYQASNGFDGQPRGISPILCVNPLTGSVNGTAGMEANLGTLVPSSDLTTGDLVPGAVPASCNAQGLLMIGDPPEMGAHVLPGNNYHIYDIPLFWANLNRDVVTRVAAWQAARQP